MDHALAPLGAKRHGKLQISDVKGRINYSVIWNLRFEILSEAKIGEAPWQITNSKLQIQNFGSHFVIGTLKFEILSEAKTCVSPSPPSVARSTSTIPR
jgi:hypothetical protein